MGRRRVWLGPLLAGRMGCSVGLAGRAGDKTNGFNSVRLRQAAVGTIDASGMGVGTGMGSGMGGAMPDDSELSVLVLPLPLARLADPGFLQAAQSGERPMNAGSDGSTCLLPRSLEI